MVDGGRDHLHTVCTTKWGEDARAVTDRMKQDVMEAYDFYVMTCPRSRFKKKTGAPRRD